VLSAQSRDHHSQELLPVFRIHMELLRVHHTQFGVGCLDAVHVLNSILQATHHHFSMCGHLGIAQDAKMSLSPWIHDQNLGSNFPNVHLAPKACDGSTWFFFNFEITNVSLGSSWSFFNNFLMPHLSALKASDWTRVKDWVGP
uniref:Uncharacterized protein n=1 Tax=Gouania willdenowi TaxID=441366 RepID=A0A8C5ECX0_GOUWI